MGVGCGGTQDGPVSVSACTAFSTGFISEDRGADSDLLSPPALGEAISWSRLSFHYVLLNIWTELCTSLVNYLHKYLLLPSRAISCVKKTHVDLKVFFSSSYYECHAGPRGPL